MKQRLTVQGLQLDISAQSQSYIDWILLKMNPMDIEDQSTVIRKMNLKILSDCYIASQLRDFLDQDIMECYPSNVAGDLILHIPFSAQLELCFAPHKAVIWLFDLENNTITLITSARTPFPLSEAFSTVRTVVVSHLHDQGWHTFHAGAVFHEGATRLIVGKSGQGKTSLILALLSGGARFVANERVLLKRAGQQVLALPFPMPILIGLGSTMQYPNLFSFAKKPEQLLSHSRRLSPKRLTKTPQEAWSTLPDKITVLPDELQKVFSQHISHPGGHVNGVILPQISADTPQLVKEASLEENRHAIIDNYLPYQKEKHYPDWMPLRFKARHQEDPSDVLELLSQQNTGTVQFYEPKSPVKLLQETIDVLS
jgi:hypothetical protein